MAIYFSRRKKNNHSRMSDINVTPMVDVMLVLLVIFMITAPLLTSGVTVNLPRGDGKVMGNNDKFLDISVDAKGRVYIANVIYKKAAVIPKVKAMVAANPSLQIMISADKKASYGEVVELMTMLRAEGIMKVGLKTDPKTNFGKK